MKNKKDFLSNYSVKISISEDFRGSGILVPVNKDTCYLLTAKHNFDVNQDDPYSISIDSLDYKNIKIKDDKNDEICKISKVVYPKNDSEDDLIIFLLKDTDEFIKNLDPIVVLKDETDDEVEHFFRGYPNGKVDLMDGLFSKNIDKNNPNIFTFKNQHQIEATYLKGYSGSGVFIKEKATFYLVGILLETKDGIYHYTCFDLSKMIDKINQVISPNIKNKKNILDIAPTDKMYTQMINRNKGSFLAIKAKQIFGTKNHVYKDLENREKLEKLVTYIKTTNKFDELEQEYQKKLADLYLLGAFIAQNYGAKKEVKKFFDKARLYDSKYIRYKNNLEDIDALEALKLGKLAYMDKNFEKAKEYLEQALYIDSTRNRIEIYELLVNLEKDKEKLIIRYEELVELYNENKIQKAKALYQLSLLYEDRENKIKKCKEALDIIDSNNNPLNYELKFKIHKHANQVLGVKPVYRNLRPILESLVKEKPIYTEELDAIIYLEELESKGEKLISKLDEVSEISEFIQLNSSYKTIHIEDLTIKLEEEKKKNRRLWSNILILEENNKIIENVAKLAIIPIVLGIFIAIFGKFTIFGFSL